MRPEHAPQGDPCAACGAPAGKHRSRGPRTRGAYFKAYNARAGTRRSRQPRELRVIGIDGEGYTDAEGRHLYTYLAACDAKGLVRELRAPEGVTANGVFAFLTSLPKEALLVGFALGYDRTKWIESWPDAAVWRLCRPDERKAKNGMPKPVGWQGFRCNLVSTRFTVRRRDEPRSARTVWDVWKFFQSSFVKALENWKIGTPEERASIAADKARRASFASIGEREESYCQLECRLLAMLVRELIDAHEAESLRLTSYFGPGSSAAIVLREHGEQRAVYPEAMQEAVYSAYFGGRFECSRVGPVEAPELFAYDITSAYPVAMAAIPCMRHGRWTLAKNAKGWREHLSLVRYHVAPHKDAPHAWGPLPHRMASGDILFPRVSAGGWAWGGELARAMALHPGVTPEAAWLWRQDCDCPPPFEARIRELFAARLVWGRGARGLVIKLLLNSLYGKSAQRAGKGRYRCMVRAGLITSATRAELLRALSLACDPSHVLELATDSVLSTSPIALERKGLGGWARKDWQGGVFLMRPGLRFSLDEAGDVAARGVGTKVLRENRARVRAAWEKEPLAPITLATPSFFHGAKLEVRKSGSDYTRSPAYGTWSDEAKTLSYSPAPKRETVRPDFSLSLWSLPEGRAFRSFPYGGVKTSALADELERMRELADDQDDPTGLPLL